MVVATARVPHGLAVDRRTFAQDPVAGTALGENLAASQAQRRNKAAKAAGAGVAMRSTVEGVVNDAVQVIAPAEVGRPLVVAGLEEAGSLVVEATALTAT
eukprot:m.20786 g.20786  ORF g.20786 m.20786 type:complete len:100 (+) comp10619_c0_seq1:372-671(+)